MDHMCQKLNIQLADVVERQRSYWGCEVILMSLFKYKRAKELDGRCSISCMMWSHELWDGVHL
jgi:hypothetical protein